MDPYCELPYKTSRLRLGRRFILFCGNIFLSAHPGASEGDVNNPEKLHKKKFGGSLRKLFRKRSSSNSRAANRRKDILSDLDRTDKPIVITSVEQNHTKTDNLPVLNRNRLLIEIDDVTPDRSRSSRDSSPLGGRGQILVSCGDTPPRNLNSATMKMTASLSAGNMVHRERREESPQSEGRDYSPGQQRAYSPSQHRNYSPGLVRDYTPTQERAYDASCGSEFGGSDDDMSRSNTLPARYRESTPV